MLKRSRTVLRWLRRLLLLVLVLLGVLLYTPAGVQLAPAILARVTNGLVQIDNIGGTLAGPLTAQRVTIRNDKMHLRFDAVQVDWNVYAWLLGKLEVSRLSVDSFTLATKGSGTYQDPARFRLPFPMHADVLAIGTLRWQKQLDFSDPGRLLFSDIEGRFASNGRQHTVAARGSRQRLQLQTNLQLDDDRAMAMAGDIRGQFSEADQRLGWQLTVDGTLPRLMLAGDLKGHAASGTLEATLTLFQRQWLEALTLSAKGINLANITPTAPETRLDIEMHAALTDRTAMTGQVAVVNQLAGAWNEQRLPLDNLTFRIDADLEQLALREIAIQRGTGKLNGDATLRDGRWLIQWSLAKLDPSLLHSRLPARMLDGDGTLAIIGAEQTAEVRLQHGGDRLTARLQNDATRLQLEALEITGNSGKATASGALAWSSGRDFNIDARIQQLNLQRWFGIADSELNLTLQSKGSLQPRAKIELNYALPDSRIAGVTVRGNGNLAWTGGSAVRTDLSLAIGDNTLTAKGDLGEQNSRLEFAIAAPQLKLPFLQGDLRGNGHLSGTLANFSAAASVVSTRLDIGEWLHVRALDWQSSLQSEPDAPLVVNASLTDLQLADVVHLTDVTITGEGRTRQHTLSLRAHSERGDWLVGVAGGWQAQRWEGFLNQLELHAQEDLLLLARSPLLISGKRTALGPARFQLGGGELQLQQLQWQDRALSTAGTVTAWPVTLLIPKRFAESDLRLAGSWDLQYRAGAPTGRINLRRDSGDLRWRDGKLYDLGIDRLALDVEVSPLALDIEGAFHGSEIGTLELQLTTPLRAAVEDFGDAPVSGLLNLNSPDLKLLGPLISTNIVTAGTAEARVVVAGSFNKPAINGEIVGRNLAVNSLGTGMRLKDGDLNVAIENTTVRLEQLRFTDDGRQKPRQKQLAAIGGGGITGKGEIDWRKQTGTLQLQFDRVGVMQLPHQWIRLSGTTEASYQQGNMALTGNLRADGGSFTLAGRNRPTLSRDVIVSGEQPPERTTTLQVDMQADLGEHFYFSGSGIESRLEGKLNFTARSDNPLRATGTIATVDGKFDGYGQQLDIERGRLNFQGLIDNPGLDVKAVRRSSAITAGVEVTGTVRDPRVRLVSDPDMPDAEKLSWLVLGKGLEDIGPNDPSILIAAGGALFGDSDYATVLDLRRKLGLKFGFRTGSLGESTAGPRSRTIDNDDASGSGTDSIMTVSKEVISGVRIGFEQVVGTNESIVLFTWSISDSLSLETRSGQNNSLDLFYTIVLGK